MDPPLQSFSNHTHNFFKHPRPHPTSEIEQKSLPFVTASVKKRRRLYIPSRKIEPKVSKVGREREREKGGRERGRV